MRLSLNVASTRVVLLDGHTGPAAAGKVIESFGHFLIGGNFAVGLIVFAILVVINFIVVTKGAERIAEVGARFTLDAMPGKQMAIDADLNAGLIDEKEARRRRAEVGEEADFFGSMDGASKFVRGDAMAGMLILFINIVGGFVIGVAQHDLSAQAGGQQLHPAGGRRRAGGADAGAADLGGRGDGGLARRQGTRHRRADRRPGVQLAQGAGHHRRHRRRARRGAGHAALRVPAHRRAASAHWPGGCAGASSATKRAAAAEGGRGRGAERRGQLGRPAAGGHARPGGRLPADRAGRQGAAGDLLGRIKGVRKKFAQDVGFLPPPVHIRDNLELKPSMYRVTLRGAVVGEGEAFPGMWLAINPGGATQALPGTKTTDPAFGLPAVWIEERQREMAQMAGFTVVDCATVVATHLSHLMQVNAARLLGRVETQPLVDHVTKLAPKLIEDVVPKMVGIATLQKVLQLLLEEGVHIRDMRSIVECLAEHAATVTDAGELARRIRVHLAPAIVQQIYGPVKELDVIALDPELERLVTQALNSPHGAALDPGVADTLTRHAAETARRRKTWACRPACWCPT